MANGSVGSPPTAHCHPIAPAAQAEAAEATLGRHLARRLVQVGAHDVFAVPGDFNLTLLDHLIAEPGLRLVGCCNELNAGYAADGYARARGVGACAVTFTVGGLSVLNAIAGSYSENLPVICIVGGPNSNDYGTNRVLHHTIGLPDFSQELRCFQTITCYQFESCDVSDVFGPRTGSGEPPRGRSRTHRHRHLHRAKGEQARLHQYQLQSLRHPSPHLLPRARPLLPLPQVDFLVAAFSSLVLDKNPQVG
ncbi:hypothetical protein GW17_00061206 [Ensete ventricosum]|nr:hypothetical protein GW17_00061206 [Ensete ventricosum]